MLGQIRECMSKPIQPWPVDDALAVGRRVLIEEADCLTTAANKLGTEFVNTVKAILKCKGRIIVSGVGKSGHVGRKIAATLASTGTPAFFVHAAEAGHGDLGMITSRDIVLVISNSGESEEVINIASFSKRFGAFIIGMTSRHNSSVAKLSDINLFIEVEKEACPLGVAPTSSTTLQLAVGDAIAMATLTLRGFSTEDFARTHPLGQLGRKYYLRVKDVMHGIDSVPSVAPATKLKDALPLMAIGRTGALLVLNNQSLVGIFTDSDLRRLITNSVNNFDSKLKLPINEFVTRNPMTIESSQLASEALQIFESKRISRLICIEKSKVQGLLSWQNLLDHKVT